MQRLCYDAACFPILTKTCASVAPQQESTGTWSHQQCLLAPANSEVSRALPSWETLALCKRGSLPRRTHHGSSLGAVKLDDEEYREQQRRQRQLKASNVTNVTQDKMCLSLFQFEVQVFMLCRLRSLILSAIMRGKSVRQLNEQFFTLIFESKATALLQSAPHWIFFCAPALLHLPH